MTTFAQQFAALTEEIAKNHVPQRPANGASDAQMKYLRDLRERFAIDTSGIDMMTSAEVRAEIDALRKRPQPPTPRQREIIAETIEELRQAGMSINISDEKLASLTGGREGTASKLIEFLFAKRNQVTDTLPITDNQVATIADWFHCPDIPFEAISTQTVYALKEGANMNESQTETIVVNRTIPRPDISEKAWQLMTREQFEAELRAKLTRSQASKFIDDNRGIYFEWRKTRATNQQKDYIRQLDQRLANAYTTREVNFAVGLDGEIIEMGLGNSRDRRPTSAHEPLSDHDLDVMSYDDASRQIDMMKAELNAVFEAHIDNDQQALQEKVSSFSERYGTGVAKDKNTAMSEEMHRLQEFIYKLEAMVGSESPELHDMVKETFVYQSHTPEELEVALSEFMALAIDTSSEDRFLKTFGALSAACEDTPLAHKVLQAM